jgi:hypothetical protein
MSTDLDEYINQQKAALSAHLPNFLADDTAIPPLHQHRYDIIDHDSNDSDSKFKSLNLELPAPTGLPKAPSTTVCPPPTNPLFYSLFAPTTQDKTHKEIRN